MAHQRISLALQGGGSHGAFTWGVLERLLEDGRVDIEAISGASAGAMNATLLAYGMTVGGRSGAAECLRAFWDGIGASQPFAVTAESFAANGDAPLGATTPALKALLFLTRFFSPYQLNPFDVNPLRDLLGRLVDFERLRQECRIELFIAATRVANGNLRVFRTDEITQQVLLASACLPTLHHSVEIEGEAYWDGGLSANPPLLPLLDAGRPDDLLMVLLHGAPSQRVPSSADEIALRLAEIGFTSGFHAEARTLQQAIGEAERSWLNLDPRSRRLRRLRLHLIDDPDFISGLATMSQANAHAGFIGALHDAGRARAEAWLASNFGDLGRRSSTSFAALMR